MSLWSLYWSWVGVWGSLALLTLCLALLTDRWSLNGLRAAAALPPLTNQHRPPPISIIRPVKGADEFTYECFRSWLVQDYNGEFECIFSLQDERDPAIAVIERLKQEGFDKRIKVCVNPVKAGYSGKNSNLFYGIQLAAHDIFVFVDSDVVAPAGTLEKIVSGVEGNGVAGRGHKDCNAGTEGTLLSCLTKYTQPKNLWGTLYAEAWNISLIGMWGTLMADGNAPGICGCVWSLKRAHLQKLGGIEAFRGNIAEDIAMGRGAKKMGLRLLLGPVVLQPVGNMTYEGMIHKFLRAAIIVQVMGRVDAGGLIATLVVYAMSYSYLFTTAWAIFMAQPLLLFWSLVHGAGRMLAYSFVMYHATGEQKIRWEVPFGDVMTIYCFARVVCKPEVEWGGIRFRVNGLGEMKRIN